MVMLSVVLGLVFNVIGPGRFIAEQNIARAAAPALAPDDAFTGLDVYYLAVLGDDALVVLAEHYPDGLPVGFREQAQVTLALRADELERETGETSWQAWNLSRERIRELVSMRELLR